MSVARRHPATAAVWAWLETGEGRDKVYPLSRDKPEAIPLAAKQRVEEIDRTFIQWDEEFTEAEEEVARDEH